MNQNLGENFGSENTSSKRSSRKCHRLVATFMPAVIVGVICVLIFQFVLLNGNVPSGSMEPTIKTGELILTNRLAYSFSGPETGDVVVFWSDEADKLLVKRVIGVGGDVINIKGGEVYINGKKVKESYISGKTWSPSKEEVTYSVPEGSVFVMGDNRENSGDSRFFENAYISNENIKGKVILHYAIGACDTGMFVHTVKSQAPVED